VYGIEVTDTNQDQLPDLIIAGNLYGVKPEIGRFDASDGLLLRGIGKGKFSSGTSDSHLCIAGEIRDLQIIRIKDKNTLVVARNNQSALILRLP
nr:hypothetical protein [Bacteroidota bacterium]